MVLIVVAVAWLESFAGVAVNPSTTLAAETANNTGAADGFVAQSNGNAVASNVSKMPIRSLLYPGSTTKIYVHFMPWFGPSNHMNIGYDSANPAQVKRQVEDMIGRGIDGAIVDWYGPLSTHHNTATLNLMRESELHPGFEFAVTEDVGAIKSASNPQQKLIDDLNYAYNTFEGSPAYMRRDGRPVVFFFGVEAIAIDWNAVRAAVLGNPLFIFRNSGAFSKAQTNGGFAWLQDQTTVTPNYMSLGYLDNFYSTALNYPQHQTFGSAFKGFDDTLASWGKKRKILQFCGQTWLASLARAGKFYSNTKQLENLQIGTWNDYEEGSELETGVDNCVSISAAIAGGTLSWAITGSETTVDHYTVFISLDGQNLMPLAEVAAGSSSLDLSAFGLAPASYTLYVKAVGKASMLNKISNAVSYGVANQPPIAALNVTPTFGATPLVVSASTAGSKDPDGTIAASTIDFGDGSMVAGATATHTYTVPGAYTLTGTVTDDHGASASQTALVNVSNQPPVAMLAVTPSSGIAPLTVSASTAGSKDPDGSIASSIINFGDGTAVSVGPGGAASHLYSGPGSYILTATVTDDRGASTSAAGTATVTANVPRLVTVSSPGSGATVTSPVQIVATATTPNPLSALQLYVDGVKNYQQTSANLTKSVSLASGAHSITVKGWDTQGAFSANVKVTVLASNQPPVAKLAIGPLPAVSPANVSISTAGSSDPDGSIASTLVSFGDGTTASVAAGGSVSHVYPTAGTYTVSSTVTDNRGAQATATSSLNVLAPYVSLVAPANGASAPSPVRVVAAAISGNPIASMKIYVDGVAVYQTNAGKVDTAVSMARGTRRVTAQAWETSGNVLKTSISINVQ